MYRQAYGYVHCRDTRQACATHLLYCLEYAVCCAGTSRGVTIACARSPWNVFDALIVVASIFSLFPVFDDVPGLSQLSLLKPLRIFRLFKRVPSLKNLLGSLIASVLRLMTTNQAEHNSQLRG